MHPLTAAEMRGTTDLRAPPRALPTVFPPTSHVQNPAREQDHKRILHRSATQHAMTRTCALILCRLGTLCFVLNSALTVVLIVFILLFRGEAISLGNVSSATGYWMRLVANVFLTALFAWEGSGMLDLSLLGFSLLFALKALDISRNVGHGGIGSQGRFSGLEWGVAVALAVLAGGLQLLRWRARAWVERTLISSDTASYTAR